MDNKQILIDNVEAKNSSFMYFLREKSEFNKDSFQQLCGSIRALADSEVEISRTAQQIMTVYASVLQCFMYHLDKSDVYKISNFPHDYSKMVDILDKSVKYYFNTRI